MDNREAKEKSCRIALEVTFCIAYFSRFKGAAANLTMHFITGYKIQMNKVA